jgi:hypothetical protein
MKNLTFNLQIIPAIGVAISLDKYHPKSKYENAYWELNILILCFHFNWTLTYPYNNN